MIKYMINRLISSKFHAKVRFFCQILVSLCHNYHNMKNLLTIIIPALLLTACSKEEANNNIVQPIEDAVKRTVVVYMSGENDLSSYVNSDINEMASGYRSLNFEANLVLFVDKAMESPFIAQMTKDESHPLDTLYKYEQDFYASDPDAMREVLERATTLCPATQDYGLVLWGHASGWVIATDSVASRRAYGRDTGDNTADGSKGMWINIPSLRKVLESTSTNWEFIFCDCCNMANAETAYELRKTAHYLIASPGEIPGDGAPYTLIMPHLFSTSSDCYKNLIDAYANYYHNNMPLAVIKLDQMEQLAKATYDILKTIEPTPDKELNLDNLIYYDGVKGLSLRSLFDMNDFLLQNTSEENYQRWKLSFDKAVIDKCFGATWMTNEHVNFDKFKATKEKFGAMSMYIPRTFYDNYKYSRDYNKTYNKLSWYYAAGWPEFGW